MPESTTFQATQKRLDLRYVLFAGTLMAALAVPQWGFACEDEYSPTFVVQKNAWASTQTQKGPPPVQQSSAASAQKPSRQQAQPSQQQKSSWGQPSGSYRTSDY